MLSANEFKSYTTERYKLHVYELLRGIKFVQYYLQRFQDNLQVCWKIYKSQYIPFPNKNIAYKIETQIKCKNFKENIEDKLK